MGLGTNTLLILGVLIIGLLCLRKMEDKWNTYPDVVWSRLAANVETASKYSLTANRAKDPLLQLLYASRAVGLLEAVNTYDSVENIERHTGKQFDAIRVATLEAEETATKKLNRALPFNRTPADSVLIQGAGWGDRDDSANQ